MSFDEHDERRVAAKSDGPPTEAELRAVERWSDAIDGAVRGTLDARQLRELDRAAESDAWLREALADARDVRARTEALPSWPAPADLDDRILSAIASDARTQPRRAPTPSPRPTLRWAATAALAATLAFVFLRGPESSRVEPSFVGADGTVYTEDQVREAVEEMETALAMLNGNIARTSSILRREMTTEFHDHLTEPVQRSFGRTVDSLPFLRPAPQDDQHSGVRFPPLGERPLRSPALPGALLSERT